MGVRTGALQPSVVEPGIAVRMSERLVVIGGDASGMTAATLAKRMRPDLEVVALEKGPWTSYSACGIPYVIGGDVDTIEELVVRTPEQHRANGIDARAMQEAVAIDLDARDVEIRDIDEGRTYRLGFDQLLVATGAVPRRPPLPGFDHEKVHGVQTLDDGAHLLAHAEKIEADRVVVVGAGYIGLEIAEAFVKREAHVTVIERESEVMPATMDPDMGAKVRTAMEHHGIEVGDPPFRGQQVPLARRRCPTAHLTGSHRPRREQHHRASRARPLVRPVPDANARDIGNHQRQPGTCAEALERDARPVDSGVGRPVQRARLRREARLVSVLHGCRSHRGEDDDTVVRVLEAEVAPFQPGRL